MRHPYCRRQRASAHGQRPKMAAPTDSDLAPARDAVGTLLASLGISAELYAVEPREGRWAVIVECATESGWQRAELQAGPELLAAVRGDADARAALLAEWRTHLTACKKD
ncbi:MAG: hypothetical protein K0M46_11870 [Thiobacillus sp.]|nr:hypothetical protein [Thiobacillus sp.]